MAFEPETVDQLRAGLERQLCSTSACGRAVALFHAKYKDVQIPASVGCVTANGIPTFCGITTNAGKARFQGVEVEGNARLFGRSRRRHA